MYCGEGGGVKEYGSTDSEYTRKIYEDKSRTYTC